MDTPRRRIAGIHGRSGHRPHQREEREGHGRAAAWAGRAGRGPVEAARPLPEELERRVLLAASLLDPTFGGGDGIVTTDVATSGGAVAAVSVLASGKILAAGNASASLPSGSPPAGDFALARYNADGSLDKTFGGGDGKATAG